MNNILSKKVKFLSLFLLLYPIIVFSYSAEQRAPLHELTGLEIMGGIGLTEGINKPNNTLSITNYVSDALKKSQRHDTPSINMSVKENITFNDRPILEAFALGPTIFFQKLRFSGEVWELQLPDFNNYTYDFTSKNAVALLEGNLYFHPVLKRFFPFIITGVGCGTAGVKYMDHAKEFIPEDSELHLKTKWNTHFAYEMGAGIAVPINSYLVTSLSYHYLYLDNGHTSRSTNVNLQQPLKLKLNSHNIYFGLSYFMQ